MKSELVIRPARPIDSKLAASLLRQAMGRMADYFFGNGHLLRDMDILEKLFVRENNRFSYNFTFLAKKGGQGVGLLLAYPAGIMRRLELFTGKHLFATLGAGNMLSLALRALPLVGYREAEDGEYFISALSVLPQFQRQNIGTRLLRFAEEEGARHNLQKCSLTVSLHNEGACRLYLKHGYQIVKTRLFSRWQQCSGDNPGYLDSGYHRMVKPLPTGTSKP